MKRYEYMLIPVSMIPPDIFAEYKLKDLVHNQKVLVEIRKWMYGLPQVRQLAYEKLLTHLELGWYIPDGITPGLFKHITKLLTFFLIVDGFGVKYTNQQDAIDLIAHLDIAYKIVTN